MVMSTRFWLILQLGKHLEISFYYEYRSTSVRIGSHDVLGFVSVLRRNLAETSSANPRSEKCNPHFPPER